MKEKKYHKARKEILGLLEDSLTSTTRRDVGDLDIPASIVAIVEQRAEELLINFEEIIRKRRFGPFWFGVSQSIVGSILLFLVLGVLAFIISGSKQNPLDMLSNRTNTQTSEQPVK